jgi:hypothetical protein
MTTDITTREMITAYLAKGAHAALAQWPVSARKTETFDNLGGELAIVQGMLSDLLDRLTGEYNAHDEHAGVFLYEVAEPAGAEWIQGLREDENSEEIWKRRVNPLLKDFFGYVQIQHTLTCVVDGLAIVETCGPEEATAVSVYFGKPGGFEIGRAHV